MADDWLFDSITKYRSLHMYDLQHAVTAMDWVGDKSLCIATSSGNHSEILELLLPDKLTAREEDTGIMKNRDFQMSTGGFHEGKIMGVKHIPSTRILAVSENNVNSVTLWKQGSEQTEIMEKMCEIPNKIPQCCSAKLAVIGGEGCHILFGSHLNNICIADVESCKITGCSADLLDDFRISNIEFCDRNTALCCLLETGDIVSMDIRDRKNKTAKYTCQGNKAPFWTMHVWNNQRLCSQLSSQGQVVIYDTRSMQKSVTSQNIGVKTDCDFEYLQISVDPVTYQQVTVSGFDDKIYLYNSTNWTNICKDSTVTPVFVHEGHRDDSDNQLESLKVVTHSWHPWQRELILSGATDGSLHAWQYLNK